MAGSATISGTQHYVLGIGHPMAEPNTEKPPVVGTGAVTDGASLTASGTYTGDQVTAPVITLGWRPTFIIVKAESTLGAAWVVPQTYYDRSFHFVPDGSQVQIIPTSTGFTLPTGAATETLQVNTTGVTYHYFAFKDNGTNTAWSDHTGSQLATRTIEYWKGLPVKVAWFKRDNVQQAVVAVFGQTAFHADGTVATSTVINADGTVTVGQGADINIWSGASGEACAALAFLGGGDCVHVTTYAGTGGTRFVNVPFDELEAVFIFPRNTTSTSPIMWTSSVGTGFALSLMADAGKLTASKITAVVGGRVTVDSGLSASAKTYTLVAFRKQRDATMGSDIFAPRPLRSSKYIQINSTGYIDCGTDDSLNINGALSLEWAGAHYNVSTAHFTIPPSGTPVNDQTLQLPLLWRSGGADGYGTGRVSYGMQINPALSNSSLADALAVAVTDYFDMPQVATGFDLEYVQPWQSGTTVKDRVFTHVLITHDGYGKWKIYINGRCVKERNVDQTKVSTPSPNIQSASGHRMVINGRQRDTSPPSFSSPYGQAFYRGAVYARELTASEVLYNYNSLFSDNTAVMTPDYREAWLLDNFVSTLGTIGGIRAVMNPGNNGILKVNCSYEGGI